MEAPVFKPASIHRRAPSIVDAMMSGAWFREPRLRRIMLVAAIVLAAFAAMFPRHYLAEAQLLPQEEGGGLAAALQSSGAGGLANLSSLIGNKQPVEADLTIARSELVLNDILSRMNLLGKPGFRTRDDALRRLHSKIQVVSIRGSILQISVKDKDPQFARALAATAADAVQSRLTTLNLAQTSQKREVAANRVKAASDRLVLAQAAMEQFRVEHHLGAPTQQLGVAVGLLANLQAQLQSKSVEIETLQRFEGPENIKLKAAEAELASLRRQVAAAQERADNNSSNLGYMASENAEYLNLYRDQLVAQLLYEIYRKYMEQVTVDTLSANESMVLMQPAYVHPERQYNMPAVALVVMLVILGVAAEFYVAAPPRRGRER
ncbi:MAG TPA: hypothetical protein VGH03_03005 [Caulobacteraceae bacterium]|jgi:capsule polysaccharide export protein KpsE/RkpR